MYDPFRPNVYSEVKYKLYIEALSTSAAPATEVTARAAATAQESALAEESQNQELSLTESYREVEHLEIAATTNKNNVNNEHSTSITRATTNTDEEQDKANSDKNYKRESTMSLHDALVSQNAMSSYLADNSIENITGNDNNNNDNHYNATLSSSLMTEEQSAVAWPMLGPLNVSTEELYQRRIQKSAELGIQRAIDLQKEEVLLAHKQRKLEKSDAKSKISNALGRMRRRTLPGTSTMDLAQDTLEKQVASYESNVESKNNAMPSTSNGEEIKRMSENAQTHNVDNNNNFNSSKTEYNRSHSAPLQFVPSPLAAGGYVLTASENITATNKCNINNNNNKMQARRELSGKPSSTLLIRFAVRCKLMSQLLAHVGCHHISQWNNTPQHQRDLAVAPLLEMLRSTGGQHAVVRSVYYYVLSNEELHNIQVKQDKVKGNRNNEESEQREKESSKLTDEQERLRLFIRFDSIAGAFKAGEEMLKSGNDWYISFYPTVSYDTGKYANA